MAVVKGSTTVAGSNEELAFSEDPDVVAGLERVGCGWCPLAEFEVVKPGAEIITVRTMNDREDARHRDHYALGEASADLVVAKIVVVSVRVEGKKKALEGKDAVKWVSKLAVQDPAALDLLAHRQIHCTRLKDPRELYPEFRARLGYPVQPKKAEAAEEPEEGNRADGDSKSEPAAGG